MGGVANSEQAVFDFTITGVVVENRRHAVFDAFYIGFYGAQPGKVIGQMTVDVPPEAIENVEEPPGSVSIDGKATGHGTINMFMGVNKRRHDQPATGINKGGIFIFLPEMPQRPDSADYAPVHCYRSIRYPVLFFRTRHNRTISKK